MTPPHPTQHHTPDPAPLPSAQTSTQRDISPNLPGASHLAPTHPWPSPALARPTSGPARTSTNSTIGTITAPATPPLRAAALLAAATLAACGSTPPPLWQTQAQSAAARATQAWLQGDHRIAQAEWQLAYRAISATGQPALLARIALMECAAQAATLVWTDCPRYTPYHNAATPADQAYARYLRAHPTAADLALLPPAQQATAAAILTSQPPTAPTTSDHCTSPQTTALPTPGHPTLPGMAAGWTHGLSTGSTPSLSHLVAASIHLRAHSAQPTPAALPQATPATVPNASCGLPPYTSSSTAIPATVQLSLYATGIASAHGWRHAVQAWLHQAQQQLTRHSTSPHQPPHHPQPATATTPPTPHTALQHAIAQHLQALHPPSPSPAPTHRP